MSAAPTLVERIDSLCAETSEGLAGGTAATLVASIRHRLREPLRLAVAGRVKAGKSTLLNALVGERLAPTDAGECTKFISWYSWSPGYQVGARLHDGASLALPFKRDSGTLRIELEESLEGGIERLEIGWPSARLQQMTLVDTPGIGSTDDLAGERTAAFFALDEDEPSDADAVLYLMRHAHHTDAEFLDSFLDRSVNNSTPVNAIGVLSRADEVGAGRLDALESANRIAARYAEDERLRPLISGVVAVAGLIAETAATFEEREAAGLRTLAAEPGDTIDEMLLSADHFLDTSLSDLTVESRRVLLQRLGMFGVRYCLDGIRTGRANTATQISTALLGVSGVAELRELIGGRFASCAHLLKARSALTSLRLAVGELAREDPARADYLGRRLEELQASAHELAELRLLHMLRVGAIELSRREASEVELVVGTGSVAERLGLDPEADTDQIQRVALRGVARWREKAASPLIDRPTMYGAEVMARSYEGFYASTV
jgi:hypothetical protein